MTLLGVPLAKLLVLVIGANMAMGIAVIAVAALRGDL